MTQHFTRNTVSASAWCPKCKKFTQHRIDGVRKGPCLDCIARLAREHATALEEKVEKQQELFT